MTARYLTAYIAGVVVVASAIELLDPSFGLRLVLLLIGFLAVARATRSLAPDRSHLEGVPMKERLAAIPNWQYVAFVLLIAAWVAVFVAV